MTKELEALQILRELVEYLTRIDDDPAALRNEVKELIINGYEDGNEYFWQIEVALNELECARHNYNALKEFYNNAVAYGAKIQAELNELKKDVARYFELDRTYPNPLARAEKELQEYRSLGYKLSRVGENENERN